MVVLPPNCAVPSRVCCRAPPALLRLLLPAYLSHHPTPHSRRPGFFYKAANTHCYGLAAPSPADTFATLALFAPLHPTRCAFSLPPTARPHHPTRLPRLYTCMDRRVGRVPCFAGYRRWTCAPLNLCRCGYQLADVPYLIVVVTAGPYTRHATTPPKRTHDLALHFPPVPLLRNTRTAFLTHAGLWPYLLITRPPMTCHRAHARHLPRAPDCDVGSAYRCLCRTCLS